MNQPQIQPVSWYPQQAFTNPAPQLQQYSYQQATPQQPQRPPVRPLNGRFIADEGEIRPDDVPMDGSVSYFPKNDLSFIVAKQWTSEGNITTVRYVPERPAPPPSTNEDFSSDIMARLDKIQEMLAEKKAPAKKQEAQKE